MTLNFALVVIDIGVEIPTKTLLTVNFIIHWWSQMDQLTTNTRSRTKEKSTHD